VRNADLKLDMTNGPADVHAKPKIKHGEQFQRQASLLKDKKILTSDLSFGYSIPNPI
jgi:hypothetical protein